MHQSKFKLPVWLFLLTSAVFCFQTEAHTPAGDMAEAAKGLLAALSPEQRTKATYEFKNDERLNWHFIPKERNGLPLKEMTPPQRHLAQALLATALSQRGYMKAGMIMSLEQILFDMEGTRRRFPRDPELYFITIFGTPGGKDPWAWRWEGHHLAFNFTILNGDQVLVSPSFMGTNPAEVREGQRAGLRVLGAEETLARQLVLSLNDQQLKSAIYTNKAPADIITVADRQARLLKPDGLPMSRMTPTQREMLMNVIKEYAGRVRGELADRDMKRIKSLSPQKISFAWAGPTEIKAPHYYRIQGPHFLIEYDNTQNDANHVHAVWRDLEHDFGGDPLKRHYEQSHTH